MTLAGQDQAPQRAVVVAINFGADTYRDAADKLREFADDLEMESRPRETVWGGNSSGGSITVEDDSTRTHEWYVAAMNDYLEAHDV